MATRARKRIQALRRAPDGSAFQKCEYCGILVAIALFGMHECGLKIGAKRSRVERGEVLNIDEQPRSPFCFFIESFKKTCKAEKSLEINQRGFNAWKNMSEKERYPYIVQAEKVNSAHLKILLEESNEMSEVDDEADSAMVGKFDPAYTDTLNYGGFLHCWKFKRSECGYKDPLNHKRSDCFDSDDWDELDTWFDD